MTPTIAKIAALVVVLLLGCIGVLVIEIQNLELQISEAKTAKATAEAAALTAAAEATAKTAQAAEAQRRAAMQEVAQQRTAGDAGAERVRVVLREVPLPSGCPATLPAAVQAEGAAAVARANAVYRWEEER